ncbi:hypothetical protein UlMin_031507, partial [Ulmus minor]
MRNTRVLFKTVMRGDWDEVVKIYEEDPEAQNDRITRSGYTALHLAVSDGNEDIVAKLVQALKEAQEGGQKDKEALEGRQKDKEEQEGRQRASEALAMKNDEGNTPLHIAASMGNVREAQEGGQKDKEALEGRQKDKEEQEGRQRASEALAMKNDEGNTPLHIAASMGNVREAQEGGQKAKEAQEGGQKDKEEQEGRQRAKKALAIQNDAGNTPLHIAASMGNVRMCELFANVDPTLIGIQNNDGETPLFLAALHGKKDAFLCLHFICLPDVGRFYIRRNDGNTILHCTIFGEYFELAFNIIHLYGDLVDFVNEKGLTPLHLLASKPSAFQSGIKLGRFQKMVYKS